MRSIEADTVLETLLLPFIDGHLSWPDEGALFLRARDGWPLHQRPLPGLICEQTFKPDADALLRAGLRLAQNTNANFPLVLALPPRQRDEARALLARAVMQTRTGGRVVACQSNNEGARSSERDLAELVGGVETLSKNKCRVFWSGPLADPIAASLASQWRNLDAPRLIADGRFLSRPGLFAWDRIDAASALLAEHLPPDLAGTAADLGAGFGYLSAELLGRCVNISALDVYEAESRALDLARSNLTALRSQASITYHWHDVTTGLLRTYDMIVSNPPFHAGGRHDRPDVGRRFIAAAAASLNPGGQLWLVANRHLPYEAVLSENFARVRGVTQAGGYKIVSAMKR
jgi:16S rRNA (guanine1207-N2)-methyltransferase